MLLNPSLCNAIVANCGSDSRSERLRQRTNLLSTRERLPSAQAINLRFASAIALQTPRGDNPNKTITMFILPGHPSHNFLTMRGNEIDSSPK
ncbi:hypothetical protein [Brunnivagina elsteri]|uniref:Uncharacterized protein n=1 Tax=Brunnivagina elsteri CCALA 953 TaxID=987040 RepID=A0A2A2TE97_9CYAN|nr:hypothetical protein [Calothrix elsteri]PAX52043.1 hypothetical protein CK510_21490 [Calothrix elsteri CCALA 953]